MKYKTLSQQFREVLRFLFVSEFISAIFYDFYNQNTSFSLQNNYKIRTCSFFLHRFVVKVFYVKMVIVNLSLVKYEKKTHFLSDLYGH